MHVVVQFVSSDKKDQSQSQMEMLSGHAGLGPFYTKHFHT